MNYGQFLRILRRYGYNRRISNEDLVNGPIAGLIREANITKLKGDDKGGLLYYDSTRACRVINNEIDISPDIRTSLGRKKVKSALETGFSRFYSEFVDEDRVGDMIDDFLSHIEKENTFTRREASEIKALTNTPCQFVTKILTKALKEPNKQIKENHTLLWKNTNSELRIIKGDILNYALGGRLKKPRIVVIPVNTAFDVHVSNALEKTSQPLVSTKTLHGQFLIRVYKSGLKEEDLQERITANLKINGKIYDSDSIRDCPIGSIAALNFGTATVYLLAVSRFDSNNNAFSSKEEVCESVSQLLKYYNSKGQGYDLYMPLIGSGMSRAGLSKQESMEILVSMIQEQRNSIYGNINIVVKVDAYKELGLDKEDF